MAEAFDLVIRAGSVIDGTGAPAREADVAIAGGRIVGVGHLDGRGREEIDAKGMIVTPGFVDIHTHYDGQVTWENRLMPSSNHGVTTVVTGNCGVGFAPCRPHQRETLVRVMEGVEDIPEAVMTEGLPWNWETFPEYLDTLSQRRYDIDFAAQVPHSAIRVYVMGERGERREPATPQDLEQMTGIVRDAVRAGAIGVSSSHHLGHRSVDGALAPSVGSPGEELLALAKGLREAGRGVFQMITDGYYEGASSAEAQMHLLRGIANASGRPVSYSLVQKAPYVDLPAQMLRLTREAQAEGLPIKAQVFPRPTGLLFGLTLSLHPFRFHPSYEAIHHLPLAERVAAMREPGRRKAILSEKPRHSNPINVILVSNYANAFALGDPPDYEPPPGQLLKARAQNLGIPIEELAYDLLLEDEGNALIMSPSSNFAHGNLEAVRQMMLHEHSLIGLGDGGAHYGMICDSSFPTSLLAFWTRDRKQGRVPLEWAVRRLTSDNAAAMGLGDRGRIVAGMKADINVIDYARLRLHPPRPVFDLPAGGRRLHQRAEGYVATLVSGEVTYRDGVATRALPGRLVRSSAA
jgi:N-acyl-D-aspartate/D-glutamate deacylase